MNYRNHESLIADMRINADELENEHSTAAAELVREGANEIETLCFKLGRLKAAAQNTLAQQRKEFARGELPDLDDLEDALEALSDDD